MASPWTGAKNIFAPTSRQGSLVVGDTHGFAAAGVCLMCMRTNIDIDQQVIREVQELTGARTKREAVDLALRELLARHSAGRYPQDSGSGALGGRPGGKQGKQGLIAVDTSVWVAVLNQQDTTQARRCMRAHRGWRSDRID